MHTHDPISSFGTENRSSTLNPFATFIVAGSVAGGSTRAFLGAAVLVTAPG